MTATTTTTPTLDLRQEWKALYTAGRRPRLIDVPPRKALAVDGTDTPGSEAFVQVFAALYPVAYALKYLVRAEQGVNYPVLAPEGVFKQADLDRAAAGGPWHWRLLVAVPDLVDARMVKRAIEQVRAKHPETPRLDDVRLVRLPGGPAAQIMHIGPYDQEQPTIDRLLAFIAAEGARPAGEHHEVYLSDPNVAPERTRTIIRHPVRLRRP